MTYSFDELQGFLKDCRKHRTTILEKLAHGKDWTIDSFSDRANSRDELAKAVYYFENNLNQAMNLLDKVHSEHFAAVKELAEVRKDNGQLAIEAVNSLKSAIDEKLVDSAVDEAKGKTLDWSKIDFKKSISETVSKTVRAERKKERQIEEHKNSFMLFGAQEEFVGDGENAEWNNTESLVKDILDECGVDDQNIMRIEKLGRGGNNPVKVVMRSSCYVQHVLKQAPKFRGYPEPCWRNLYISPHRTKEQQVSHKKLVEKLKEQIRKDNSKRWVIRGRDIVELGPFERTKIRERPDMELTMKPIRPLRSQNDLSA